MILDVQIIEGNLDLLSRSYFDVVSLVEAIVIIRRIVLRFKCSRNSRNLNPGKFESFSSFRPISMEDDLHLVCCRSNDSRLGGPTCLSNQSSTVTVLDHDVIVTA